MAEPIIVREPTVYRPSPEFFDDLISHPEVRDTYLGWALAEELRTGYAYGAFPCGGIMWEE